MTTLITDSQIETLRAEAGAAGDLDTVALCYLALGEEIDERREALVDARAAMLRKYPTCDAARSRCASIVADAQ